MPDALDRLTAALADRYSIERELGADRFVREIRDIKPKNIMIHDGHAVVTDFGIGKAVTAAGDKSVGEEPSNRSRAMIHTHRSFFQDERLGHML